MTTIEITEEQLEAIKDLADDIQSMIGGADNDEHWQNCIDKIDEVLEQNKLTPRTFG